MILTILRCLIIFCICSASSGHLVQPNGVANGAIGIVKESFAQTMARLIQPALIIASYSNSSTHASVVNDSYSFNICGEDFFKARFISGEVKIYRPFVFDYIRKLSGFPTPEYINALIADDLLCICSDSKSGQAFWRSSDGRIVLKTIKHYECKNLLSVVDSLCLHMATGPSAIASILGVYRVRLKDGRTKYFMAASNVYPVRNINDISQTMNHQHFLKKYDLKGSTVGRVAKKSSDVLKDVDLMTSGVKLSLGKARQSLLRVLYRDAIFLNRHKFMDYSLLVATETKSMNHMRRFFNPNRNNAALVVKQSGKILCLGDDALVYHFGIIDFLQRYTFRKWLETILKALYSDVRKISCIPPKHYAMRFSKFMFDHTQ